MVPESRIPRFPFPDSRCGRDYRIGRVPQGARPARARRDGLSVAVLAAASAAAGPCLPSALPLVRRPALVPLMAAVPVPAALAGAQLLAAAHRRGGTVQSHGGDPGPDVAGPPAAGPPC